MDHKTPTEEKIQDQRGPAVTGVLDGVKKFGPNQFLQQVVRGLGGRLNERQVQELESLMEDASFWAEHDSQGDNSKHYYFCMAAGNLAKAEESGDPSDLKQAWRLYSRFNPYTGNKEGPGA